MGLDRIRLRRLEEATGSAALQWADLCPDDVDGGQWQAIGDVLQMMPRSMFAPFKGYLHTLAIMRRDRPQKLLSCTDPVLTAAVAAGDEAIAGALAVGRRPTPAEWASALAAMEAAGEALKVADAALDRECELGLVLGAADLAAYQARGTTDEAAARGRLEKVRPELAAARAATIAANYQYGRDGEVIPDLAGGVRKRRRDRKP